MKQPMRAPTLEELTDFAQQCIKDGQSSMISQILNMLLEVKKQRGGDQKLTIDEYIELMETLKIKVHEAGRS